jgi:hypothetical protein
MLILGAFVIFATGFVFGVWLTKEKNNAPFLEELAVEQVLPPLTEHFVDDCEKWNAAVLAIAPVDRPLIWKETRQ